MIPHPAHDRAPDFCPCPEHRVPAEELPREGPGFSAAAERIAAYSRHPASSVQSYLDAVVWGLPWVAQPRGIVGMDLEVSGSDVSAVFEFDTEAVAIRVFERFTVLAATNDPQPTIDKRRRCVCPVSGLPVFETLCHRCGGRRRKAR